jgi:hypothetical protein
MQDSLEKVREELKTVDDLSLVLNRLFTEYGSTLDSNFMFFAWGGRSHILVQLQAPGAWQRMSKFAKWCQEHGLKVDEQIMARMEWPNMAEVPTLTAEPVEVREDEPAVAAV